MNESLAERRILITGAGAGIGRATARAAIGLGARVAILDRDGPAAERTARTLGDRALAVPGDVTDGAAVARALDAMAQRWGGIDDLVNNAGTYDHAPLLELSLERWQQVFDVNFFAVIGASNAAARRMTAGGSIVNVSSVLGQVAAPTRGPYCVSKAALIALTKMQAVEWAERGIRVNAIAPGYIESKAVLALEAAGGMDGAAVRKRTPLGRFGTEEEVAAGIVFLLDRSRAAYVTGTVLEVSGGWMAYGYV